jgi:hypothetical protein
VQFAKRTFTLGRASTLFGDCAVEVAVDVSRKSYAGRNQVPRM